MFLGKTYQEFGSSLVGDSVIVLKGRVSVRDDGKNLHAVSMFMPDLGVATSSGPLVLSMPEFRATTDVVTELGAVLGRHAGDTEVRLRLLKGDNARTFAPGEAEGATFVFSPPMIPPPSPLSASLP